MSAAYLDLIPTFPLFQGFTPDGAALLMERGMVRELGPGTVLFQEGDAPTSVLLVLSGNLEVFVERKGRPWVLATPGPGTIVGELAVLCGIPRSAAVRAPASVTVLEWDDAGFRRLLLGHAFLAQRILGESLRTLVEKERSLIESLMNQERQAP